MPKTRRPEEIKVRQGLIEKIIELTKSFEKMVSNNIEEKGREYFEYGSITILNEEFEKLIDNHTKSLSEEDREFVVKMSKELLDQILWEKGWKMTEDKKKKRISPVPKHKKSC